MAFKIPFNPLRFPFHFSRIWLVQPIGWAFFFLMPQFNIFRADVMTERLVFLGQSYPFEPQYLMWIPLVFFAGVLLIGLVSIMWGRLFCGWTCPHNTMTEWTRILRSWMSSANPLRIVASLLGASLWTFLASYLLLSYFVSPQWIIHHWLLGDKFRGVLMVVQGLITMVGLFLLYSGHHFCRSCCPYGLLQGMSAYLEGKWMPMEIRFKQPDLAHQCGPCTGCQKACPIDLDPRQFVDIGAKLGPFDGCFNCGECIDACESIQSYKKRPGFLTFQLFPQRPKHKAETETIVLGG